MFVWDDVEGRHQRSMENSLPLGGSCAKAPSSGIKTEMRENKKIAKADHPKPPTQKKKKKALTLMLYKCGPKSGGVTICVISLYV